MIQGFSIMLAFEAGLKKAAAKLLFEGIHRTAWPQA
jgi:hypothetical protein